MLRNEYQKRHILHPIDWLLSPDGDAMADRAESLRLTTAGSSEQMAHAQLAA